MLLVLTAQSTDSMPPSPVEIGRKSDDPDVWIEIDTEALAADASAG